MKTFRVLTASPIRQRPVVLNEFLLSLKKLNLPGIEMDFLFVDDNEDAISSKLLLDFKRDCGNTRIVVGEQEGSYLCNETTHNWNEELVWKVARYKDIMIDDAKNREYDYLFLIDSDLVLHPDTVKHLIRTEKDIVSTVFWTKWQPDMPELPQVWLRDHYSQVPMRRGENLSEQEQLRRHSSFLKQLRTPGIYEVGGLGACTLISKKALHAGVSFNEIKNISFWGEDRHFCIRAAALGLPLYVDTHYPAFHIYRESDLKKLPAFQLEITKDRIAETLYLGISGLGTYNYLSGYQIDWTTFFEGYLKESLVQTAVSNESEHQRSKLNTKSTISEIKFRSIDEQKAVVEFVLSQQGIKNDESFDELLECSAQLMQKDDDWFIVEFVTHGQKIQEEPKIKSGKPKLTLSMIVKNEEDHYLREVLTECRQYIDEAVIIDDASTDNSVDICNEVLQGIPIRIIRNTESKFSNEVELRKQQWEETLKTKPDWILNIDADQIFEKRFKDEVKELIDQDEVDVYYFRLYDFWSMDEYREDSFWFAHKTFRPFLFRYRKDVNYVWKETAQHCGSFPANINQLPSAKSILRLKHYGWAKEEDRIIKYKRYQKLDPNAEYGWKEQYESILDPKPNLVKWVE
ncbi:glycosyltransferase [Gorillibacterium timonense]|uniref:glycosyltransferase n=1 Tax=Gorillibacterium timonense TaxID=1689269 RepID=UPI00071D461C|nr:glycosyltransferase family 2 protein [Gorillibacterium timonense]